MTARRAPAKPALAFGSAAAGSGSSGAASSSRVRSISSLASLERFNQVNPLIPESALSSLSRSSQRRRPALCSHRHQPSASLPTLPTSTVRPMPPSRRSSLPLLSELISDQMAPALTFLNSQEPGRRLQEPSGQQTGGQEAADAHRHLGGDPPREEQQL